MNTNLRGQHLTSPPNTEPEFPTVKDTVNAALCNLTIGMFSQWSWIIKIKKYLPESSWRSLRNWSSVPVLPSKHRSRISRVILSLNGLNWKATIVESGITQSESKFETRGNIFLRSERRKISPPENIFLKTKDLQHRSVCNQYTTC